MIVTITSYKRPELLARCLESITKANLSPVSDVLVSCDWYSKDMCDRMFREWSNAVKPPTTRWLYPAFNKRRMGVANHPRYVFEHRAPDHDICALEEDTIVSPDCFLFASWALRQPGYQFVNLADHKREFARHNPHLRNEDVHEDWELRSPYGWAFTPTFWRGLEPQWNGKIREPYGWDWQLTHLCYREGWRSLTPEVARVYNTGRENGTYDTPGNWDATQRDVVLCQARPYSIEYKLVSHERPPREQWPEWVIREIQQ